MEEETKHNKLLLYQSPNPPTLLFWYFGDPKRTQGLNIYYFEYNGKKLLFVQVQVLLYFFGSSLQPTTSDECFFFLLKIIFLSKIDLKNLENKSLPFSANGNEKFFWLWMHLRKTFSLNILGANIWNFFDEIFFSLNE